VRWKAERDSRHLSPWKNNLAIWTIEQFSGSLAANKLVDETWLKTCYTLPNQIWNKIIKSLKIYLFTCMKKQSILNFCTEPLNSLGVYRNYTYFLSNRKYIAQFYISFGGKWKITYQVKTLLDKESIKLVMCRQKHSWFECTYNFGLIFQSLVQKYKC